MGGKVNGLASEPQAGNGPSSVGNSVVQSICRHYQGRVGDCIPPSPLLLSVIRPPPCFITRRESHREIDLSRCRVLKVDWHGLIDIGMRVIAMQQRREGSAYKNNCSARICWMPCSDAAHRK